MGSNVKYLMSLRNAVLAAGQARARQPERRPDQLDVAPDRRPEGRAGRRCARSPAASPPRPCASGRRPSAATNYLRELGKSYPGIGAALRQRSLHELAGRRLDAGRLLVPGAGPGHDDRADPAQGRSTTSTSPASTPATPSSATWRARSTPARRWRGGWRSATASRSNAPARRRPTVVELAIVVAILFIIGSIVLERRRRSAGAAPVGAPAAPERIGADARPASCATRSPPRLTPPAGTRLEGRPRRHRPGRRVGQHARPHQGRAPPQDRGGPGGGDRPGRRLRPLRRRASRARRCWSASTSSAPGPASRRRARSSRSAHRIRAAPRDRDPRP